MVASPFATPVTTPFETVATEAFEDAHETAPPLQVAVSVTVPPLLTAAYPLSIVTVAVVACVTVTVQEALLPPAVAVRTAVPTPFAVTTPL